MSAIAKPQSHADAAATALRQALAAANAPLREAVTAYRTAWAELTADTDLLDVLRAAGGLVLAAEAIVAASKQLEATARSSPGADAPGHRSLLDQKRDAHLLSLAWPAVRHRYLGRRCASASAAATAAQPRQSEDPAAAESRGERGRLRTE